VTGAIVAARSSGARAQLTGAVLSGSDDYGAMMWLVTTNYERAFAPHPAVYQAWGQLNVAIKGKMDLRRYELATLAAAVALRSSYCSLAHGQILAEQLGEDVIDIIHDRANAGLSAADIAVMDLAERVVLDATAVTAADRERLHDLGVSEDEVGLVILAAAARCFFSKSLDGLGAEPDPIYHDLDPDLRDALVVGRAIQQRPGELAT
jgi:alkylhydroperoxidase family enzyme